MKRHTAIVNRNIFVAINNGGMWHIYKKGDDMLVVTDNIRLEMRII